MTSTVDRAASETPPIAANSSSIWPNQERARQPWISLPGKFPMPRSVATKSRRQSGIASEVRYSVVAVFSTGCAEAQPRLVAA